MFRSFFFRAWAFAARFFGPAADGEGPAATFHTPGTSRTYATAGTPLTFYTPGGES